MMKVTSAAYDAAAAVFVAAPPPRPDVAVVAGVLGCDEVVEKIEVSAAARTSGYDDDDGRLQLVRRRWPAGVNCPLNGLWYPLEDVVQFLYALAARR